MSLEPEKPIESLLRRYARKRRERAGESWELHPATRRLLQQEVARRFAKKGKTSGSWLGHLIPKEWLRPIAAMAGIAVLVLTAWVFLAGQRNRATKSLATAAAPEGSPTSGLVQLAANDQAAPIDSKAGATVAKSERELVAAKSESLGPTPSLAETLRSPATPESRLDKDKSDAEVPKASQDVVAQNSPGQAPAATATAAGANPAPDASSPESLTIGSPTAAADTSVAAPSKLSAAQESRAARAPSRANEPLAIKTASAGSPMVLRDSAKVALISTNVIQYGLFTGTQAPRVGAREQEPAARRLLSTKLKALAIQRVLTSFRLEQEGRELRVIDSDGSIYAGPLQSTNVVVSAAMEMNAAFSSTDQLLKKQGQSGETVTPTEAVARGSAFQLIGTNKSLKCRLVFTGTLTTNENAIAGRLNRQPGGGLGGVATGVQAPVYDNLRLSGTAVLEGVQPIGIEAGPAGP